MKRLGFILSTFFVMALAHANQKPVNLDKIFFQITAKQWVSTNTALLTVNINATLSNANLAKARAAIMERLTKIAAGEWHLTAFNRSQDSSGLEKLNVTAQARVSQSDLTNVYQNAKSVSRPGENYSITNIEFKPGLEEIQTVRVHLRQKLYQQVNDEIMRINKQYSGQNYSVSRLLFSEGENPIQPKAFRAEENNTLMLRAASAAPALAVSNELTLSAMVIAASNRSNKDD